MFEAFTVLTEKLASITTTARPITTKPAIQKPEKLTKAQKSYNQSEDDLLTAEEDYSFIMKTPCYVKTIL